MQFNIGDQVRVKSTGLIHKVMSINWFWDTGQKTYTLVPPCVFNEENDLELVPEDK